VPMYGSWASTSMTSPVEQLAPLMACKYSPLGTPRGRYDEHSSKSSLSCETKVYRTSRRKPNFRR
jgi:hypothetical protein